MLWRRKWQCIPVFLAGKHTESGVYSPWGSQRVKYELVTEYQQQQKNNKGFRETQYFLMALCLSLNKGDPRQVLNANISQALVYSSQ